MAALHSMRFGCSNFFIPGGLGGGNMINYPIGIQTFEKIRSGDFLYVDKTKYIYELAHRYQYVFLFPSPTLWKVTTCQHIRELFPWEKGPFNGLAIADLETEWFEYPVLHFPLTRLS